VCEKDYDKAIALLRDLEWEGTSGMDHDAACPECGCCKMEVSFRSGRKGYDLWGHDDRCRLSRLIHESQRV
jgi:hypothetical protein